MWESGKYIIIFDGNGATSGAMEQQTLSVGEKLQANQFVKGGYLFSGWNRAADGSDVGYGDLGPYGGGYQMAECQAGSLYFGTRRTG